MVFITKALAIIVSIIVSYLILRYTEPIVRNIGKSSWAEQYLGNGGSYTMWKIIGLILPVAVIAYTIYAWK